MTQNRKNKIGDGHRSNLEVKIIRPNLGDLYKAINHRLLRADDVMYIVDIASDLLKIKKIGLDEFKKFICVSANKYTELIKKEKK